MDERDIKNRHIWITQQKTKAKRRIEIAGELKSLIERIMARKVGHKIRSTRLIVCEDGSPMTYAKLRSRFDAARAKAGIDKSAFQMRDLRAKAGTDKAEASAGNSVPVRSRLRAPVITRVTANQATSILVRNSALIRPPPSLHV